MYKLPSPSSPPNPICYISLNKTIHKVLEHVPTLSTKIAQMFVTITGAYIGKHFKNEDLTTQDLSKHVETAGLVMFESAV